MFWKQNKWKILVPTLILLALAAAFVFGDQNLPAQTKPAEPPISMPVETIPMPNEDAAPPVEQPEVEHETPEQTISGATDASEEVSGMETDTDADKDTNPNESAPAGEPENVEYETPEQTLSGATGKYEEVNGMMIDTGTGKDKYLTDPVPEGKPAPVEPENAVVGDGEFSCSLSISCATILNNMELCDPEKVELVPEDGWILEPMIVTFYEGESVFNVLQRTCKQEKIHMEFSNTPVYNSAYIEGIHNLYEFDVGNLSGWMYKVNDWFPNYGCSRYQLKDGDIIEWVYTCDLGNDVGGGYATGSGE